MISGTPLLGSVLTSFFTDHLKLQRGLRPNSITSYADAMRLFLQFAAATSKRKITQLGLDDLGADVVSQFFNSLEERRGNTAQSRNQRLAALRTFFEYVAQRFPERLGHAQKVATIPMKRTQPPQTIFLERDEIEGALARVPVEGHHALRDRTLCCFCTTRDLVCKRRQTFGPAMSISIPARACTSTEKEVNGGRVPSGRRRRPCSISY